MTAALRAYEHWWVRYRHTWRSTIIASFIEPLVYLGAMGVGLGSYIDDQGSATDALGGLKYLWFIAPGLLASVALQIGSAEASWPVLGAFRWDKSYRSMYHAPLRPLDIALGHLGWMATRITMAVVAFSTAMVLFGTWRSALAPVGMLTAALGGVAFCSCLAAWSATKDKDDGFVGVNRFLVIPMFLFSGTFYPVSQLPDAVEPFAQALPLYHSVELTRGFTLGELDVAMWWHLAYLLVMLAVGVTASARVYRRRLQA